MGKGPRYSFLFRQKHGYGKEADIGVCSRQRA